MNLGGTLVKPVEILMALCLLGLLSFVLVTHGVTEPPLQGLRNSGDTPPHDGPATLAEPFPAPQAGTWRNQGQASGGEADSREAGRRQRAGDGKGERETLVPKTLGRTCPLPSPQAKTLRMVLKARKPPWLLFHPTLFLFR